jgi:DNA-binding NtrC family response regulator
MTKNRKILVVDDNTKYCESVLDVLEIEGYEAVGVHDGFKAIEAIDKDSYDLVLMDIKMPRMDGIDTFKKLKEISSKIPTIMMTAFALEDRIREGLRTGVFGAFQKPINYERLFCSIERAFPDGALVMIADNNKESCFGLRDVLVEKEYRVVTAREGEIAVQLVREKRFDIIILDNQLPDINDIKTYQTIRSIRPDVPVISVTESEEEAGGIDNKSVGKDIYAYLEKPLDMDRLLGVMQKALENRC